MTRPTGRRARSLAIEYGSLRNAVLYPAVTATGAIQEPKTVLSAPQARRLLGRTRALVKKIKPLL